MARRRKKKRVSPIRRAGKIAYRTLVALSAVIVVLFCAYQLGIKKPGVAETSPVSTARPQVSGNPDTEEEESSGPERKPDTYTFLLAASDQVGGGADTIMVCMYDTVNQEVGLLSIPRDTLVDRDFPKINAVYSEGPEALMTTVSDMLGIPIDHYVTVNINGFVELVDAVGGIDFDVPVYMNYYAPDQDLRIRYDPGMQHLTGQQALEVARCRKNSDGPGEYPDNIYDAYPDADIGRTRTQQAMISAILKKLLANPQKAPQYAEILFEHVQTDLELRELLWFVEPALGFDFSTGIQSNTLTGDGTVRYNGVSWCYQLDPDVALELVNELVNPYTTDITADQMNIFQAQ